MRCDIPFLDRPGEGRADPKYITMSGLRRSSDATRRPQRLGGELDGWLMNVCLRPATVAEGQALVSALRAPGSHL